MTPPNFMVIGLEIGKLHRGGIRPPLALPDSEKPDLFRIKRGFTYTLARSDSQISPVSSVLNYLHLRGNAPGPLFIFKYGSPLTHAKVSYLKSVSKVLSPRL